MKQIDWINKYGNIIIIGLLVLIFMQTCSTGIRTRKINKSTVSVAQKVDSTNINLDKSYIITKEELRLILEIQKLQTIKQMLYDWNSVVRTVVRPDDRMNYYDNEIKKLENQLEQLRANDLLKNK
jgi:hypothetical protein